MHATTLLDARPHEVCPDSFLIPTFGPAPGGAWVSGHSLLVRGAEPVIIDTGSLLARDQWFANVESLVDLEDVRWVFVSHDDHDHVGNLLEVLERCPNATLVASFLITGRLAGDVPLPPDRMRWLEVGDTFDAGDRALRLVRPPVFDSPATRGLLDESTGLLWAVDSFGSLTQGAVFERGDVPDDLYDFSFVALNAWNTPWLEWIDRDRFMAHLETTRRLEPAIVASAHGPVLRGGEIADAYRRTLDLAGNAPPPLPGQADLDLVLV